MTNSSPTSKLTRENAAILLVDHQVGLVVGSRYPDPETLRRNVLGMVRAAEALDVPVIATTTMDPLFGRVFPELEEALGSAAIIERTKIDPFDDARITDAITASACFHKRQTFATSCGKYGRMAVMVTPGLKRSNVMIFIRILHR